MKTNILLVIVIVIVLLIGGFLYFSSNTGQVADTQEISTATLSVDRTLHDFGEVDIFGGTVTTDFTLTNEGPGDITIIGGTTSCGCTTAEIQGTHFGMHEEMQDVVVIPAGASRTLTVVYDPLAHGPSGVGLAQRSVFLTTSSTVVPELEVRIKAMVVNNNAS